MAGPPLYLWNPQSHSAGGHTPSPAVGGGTRRLRTVVCVLALVGAALAAGRTQAQPADVCSRAIAVAEQFYVEQLYDDVEPEVLSCVYELDAAPADVQAAYRILALTFIKQGEIEDARQTVIKLLGADYSYEPDPLVDLPLYVALVDAVKAQLRVGEGVGAASPSDTVDINTATEQELETVVGIGPALAARIVEFRSQNGPFQSVDTLVEVRGIGPQTLERMRDQVTVGTARFVVRAGGGVPAEMPDEAAPTGPLLNLNTATAEELDALNGIGPVLAARIVEYRTAHGPFRYVEDVMEVRGIGPAKLEEFADRVTVE